MAVCGDLVARASGPVLSKIYIYKNHHLHIFMMGLHLSSYPSISNPITSTTEGTETPFNNSGKLYGKCISAV